MPKRKERRAFTGVVFSVLMVLTALSISRAGINMHSVLNSPEDYEGRTIVFDDTLLGGKIVHNHHYGFYCLDVEIQGKHVAGYLYRSQLNFVVFSEEFAKELSALLEKGKVQAKEGHEVELLDHVSHKNAFRVRVTCIIERFQDYWVANVKKVEIYGKQGEIVETLE